MWLPAYAEGLGGKRPRKVPTFLARLLAGSFWTELEGSLNVKTKSEPGWQPEPASWRVGFVSGRD